MKQVCDYNFTPFNKKDKIELKNGGYLWDVIMWEKYVIKTQIVGLVEGNNSCKAVVKLSIEYGVDYMMIQYTEN